ncbi:MAG: FHA domain-containing protein [Gammaproteobacteria bacterium]|nr:FHA domain-containing protein [Gammaproteobacteria bacterium]MDH3464858.1 FHA domain-containing protein [Gammaproteobacteria bacterium]
MYGKIVLVVDGKAKREYLLTANTAVIGRGRECNVRLKDLAASSRHAAIISVRRDSIIEDLGSTNGTYVNGTAISKRVLSDGDVIEIGSNTMVYQSANQTPEIPD